MAVPDVQTVAVLCNQRVNKQQSAADYLKMQKLASVFIFDPKLKSQFP